MRSLISVVVLILLAAISAHAQRTATPPTRTYIAPSEACGRAARFQFDYFATWVVVPPTPDASPCGVTLRDGSFDEKTSDIDAAVYTASVGVPSSRDFLNVAAEQGFDFVHGKWVTFGRQGYAFEAQVVDTNRWNGVRAEIDAGCSLKDAGTVSCTMFRAVLRNDDDQFWTIDAGAQADELMDLVISTFRFLERP